MSISSAQAIQAKCRGMYAKLLDREDYDALLGKSTVAQIADYLKKETPYSYVLRRINVNDVHRGQLEQVFKKSLFYDYERLLKFSTGDYKPGIHAMFEAHEIDDLKLVICSICSDHDSLLTEDDLTYVKHYSAFRPSALLEAGSMETLTENLKDTRYYKPLHPFAVRENPDFRRIDAALNLLNFRAKITAFRKRLSGASNRVAMELYGTEIDLSNILFIYRVKKVFNYPAEEILVDLIPYYGKITSRELLELAECDNLPTLIAMIGRTRYGFLFPADNERAWETLHMEYLYRMHHRNLRLQGGNIGVALSYLFLKETDIKNIITIIEGVRYAISTKEIASSLIGYGQAAASLDGR